MHVWYVWYETNFKRLLQECEQYLGICLATHTL